MTMSSAGATATSPSQPQTPAATSPRLSRYELQKRRDWHTFMQYLHEHRPPLVLSRCSGAHVLEFLRYVDRFGKTRVHASFCPSYGGRGGASTAACQCPLRQAWGSLDALVGRLRAAFDERHGRSPAVNPFAARAVNLYLNGVRDAQARARGISYHKMKKRKSKAKNNGVEANNVHGNDMAATADVDMVQPPTATAPPLVNGMPFVWSGASNVVGAYCDSCGFYSPMFDAFKY